MIEHRITTSPAMSNENDYVFFYRVSDPYGEFSQWYEAVVDDGENQFMNAEQHMTYMKAVLFNDSATAEKVINTTGIHPARHRKMGRNLSNFNAVLWNDRSPNIAAGVNWYKFTQNTFLKDMLLSTGDKTIVQCNPYDRTWGIGFSRESAMTNANSWGENRLGKALMTVRNEIRKTNTS